MERRRSSGVTDDDGRIGIAKVLLRGMSSAPERYIMYIEPAAAAAVIAPAARSSMLPCCHDDQTMHLYPKS